MIRTCVYCGLQERGNSEGKCKDGFPHCFLFDPQELRPSNKTFEGFPWWRL